MSSQRKARIQVEGPPCLVARPLTGGRRLAVERGGTAPAINAPIASGRAQPCRPYPRSSQAGRGSPPTYAACRPPGSNNRRWPHRARSVIYQPRHSSRSCHAPRSPDRRSSRRYSGFAARLDSVLPNFGREFLGPIGRGVEPANAPAVISSPRSGASSSPGPRPRRTNLQALIPETLLHRRDRRRLLALTTATEPAQTANEGAAGEHAERHAPQQRSSSHRPNGNPLSPRGPAGWLPLRGTGSGACFRHESGRGCPG